MERGELIIIAGPSGAGKTTLIRSVLDDYLADLGRLAFSVSYTTRPARQGEVEGKDYYFVDQQVFESMVAEDRFLEWATVHKHYKGTSRDEVLPRLERGEDVILDIDVQGAEQVLDRYPEACSIFILPPSYEDLQLRLQGRNLDDPEQMATRLAVSLREIERYPRYEYAIINRDAERASRALAAIILDKRHRLERMREKVEGIVGDFQEASR
jgi:guanylate kinase